MRLHTAALSLAGLLVAQPLAAFGQVVLPLGGQPAGQQSAAPVLSPAAAEEAMAPVEVDPDLRRLPASRLALRLEGETDSRELPVYLTAAQAAAPAQLQIGYMNAVSVMPEGSSLTASINDVEIGQITIAAAEVPARARLDVPPGLLQPGYNAIRIRARQRHRVDCSLAGTYELWTELQPGITGLAFLAEAKGFETFADIAAVNPGADGAVTSASGPAETRNSAMVARMLRSVEQAVLAAAIAHTRSSTSTRRRRKGRGWRSPSERRPKSRRSACCRPGRMRRRASRCFCRRHRPRPRAASPSWSPPA